MSYNLKAKNKETGEIMEFRETSNMEGDPMYVTEDNEYYSPTLFNKLYEVITEPQDKKAINYKDYMRENNIDIHKPDKEFDEHEARLNAQEDKGWEERFNKQFVVKSNAGTDLLRYTDANLIKHFIKSERELWEKGLVEKIETLFYNMVEDVSCSGKVSMEYLKEIKRLIQDNGIKKE